MSLQPQNDLAAAALIDAAAEHLHAARFGDAEAAARQVLESPGVSPARQAQAWRILAVVAHQHNRVSLAADLMRNAVALAPDDVNYITDLTAMLAAAGRFDEAIEACGRAMARWPREAFAYNNAAISLKARGDLSGAMRMLRQAIERQPDSVDMHWNLSLMLLQSGNWTEGWREFEWRLKRPHLRPPAINAAQWTGQDCAGKSLLLYTEGGFGDAMQFIRYAPLAAARGATVIVQCQEQLSDLFEYSLCVFPRESDDVASAVARVFVRGQLIPAVDFYSPLQSLPLVFQTMLENVPSRVPYLFAPREEIDYWSQRMSERAASSPHGEAAGRKHLKVGLIWAGSAHPRDSRSRSLEVFAPLAEIPGAMFYALQCGPASDDPVPVWMLTAAAPDFRWLLDRGDSPWYPTMRLFRQRQPDSWDEPVTAMARELIFLRGPLHGKDRNI